MLKFYYIICAIFILHVISMAGNNPAAIRAIRVTSPPRIDGFLSDEAWKSASPADHFTQLDPEEGRPASEATEIRVLYDDDGRLGDMVSDAVYARVRIVEGPRGGSGRLGLEINGVLGSGIIVIDIDIDA